MLKNYQFLIVSNLCFFLAAFYCKASTDSLLIAGPMVGHVSNNSAIIWMQLNKSVSQIELNYWLKDEPQSVKKIHYKRSAESDSLTEKLALADLLPSTVYHYELLLNNVKQRFTFQPQFKTPVIDGIEDFTFLIGSCLNIPDDKSGKQKVGSPKILEAMVKSEADMMLWLGDNVYLTPYDIKSPQRMRRRYTHTRSHSLLLPLLATKANLSTWDDHDFGPDNSSADFKFAEESQNIFNEFWCNKDAGNGNKGIYHSFKRADCHFVFTDSRSFRDPYDLSTKAGVAACADKNYFGKEQLEWIKNELRNSTSSFKFIIIGNQALNKKAEKECLVFYKREFDDLIQFITENKIDGIVFISGDRHFSELIKYDLLGGYSLYDYTSSALTSEIRAVNKTSERDNPQRVPNTLVTENNYGKLKVFGSAEDRKVQLFAYDRKGRIIWDFTLSQKELRFK